MENPELNSKSEDTNPRTTDPVIEPMATQYRAIIPMIKEDLQIIFDEFWEVHGDDIIRTSGYKGRKRKHGKIDMSQARKVLEKSQGVSNIYQSALSSWANKYLDKHYEAIQEKIMFVTESRLDKWDTDEPFIICFFYFWPRLNYFKDLDFNLKRRFPRDAEAALQARLKALQNQFRYYDENPSGEISEDMEVLMDIIASIDGEPYEKGTIRSNWFDMGRLSSPELKAEILKHKVGDLFEVSFDNILKKYAEGETPEKIDAQVKIHDSRIARFYGLDDPELYKLAKFETKEAFIEKFHKEYEAYMDNSEKHVAFDEIMSQLTMGGKLDPIPQSWITTSSILYMKNHIKSMGGDKDKAMKAVGATTDEQYARMINGQIIQDTVNRMAVRAYASIYKLPDNPDIIAAHILSKVTWVE